MDFKVGDRVRIRRDSGWYRSDGRDYNNPIDTVGTVIEGGGGWYVVRWFPNLTNGYCTKDLKLVNYTRPIKYMKRHEF
jgi:hypothetical protein